MAYRGKMIANHITGQSIEFLTTAGDSNGQLLEMITTYRPYSAEPAAHYHPAQHETFTVMQGELTVKIDGTVHVLTPGDTLEVPQRTIHSMWNNSPATTVVRWKVEPALHTEYFLETAMGLAADGNTGANGMPGLLQVAALARKHNKEFRLAKPPYIVQQVVFSILAPVARLLGKQPAYNKYIDAAAPA